ncbi:MAG: hypothetical protein PHR30_16515 [Gallionellaceae bacterium]|nr:hypothetical protein [Gallionellaceae bacterium]
MSEPVCGAFCDERMGAMHRYFEARLEAQRQLLDERDRAQQMALKLQAEEYERRLATLNNAHARADHLAQNIIGREVYVADAQRNEKDHEGIRHDLTVIQTRAQVWAATWGVLATVLALAISVVFHFVK